MIGVLSVERGESQDGFRSLVSVFIFFHSRILSLCSYLLSSPTWYIYSFIFPVWRNSVTWQFENRFCLFFLKAKGNGLSLVGVFSTVERLNCRDGGYLLGISSPLSEPDRIFPIPSDSYPLLLSGLGSGPRHPSPPYPFLLLFSFGFGWGDDYWLFSCALRGSLSGPTSILSHRGKTPRPGSRHYYLCSFFVYIPLQSFFHPFIHRPSSPPWLTGHPQYPLSL